MTQDLQHEWASDMAALSADAQLSDRIFATLMAHYGEEGRHYHGISHLRALFGLIKAHAPQPAASAVRLAIWWHDVIYDPLSKDNEEQSALLAREHLGQFGANPSLIDQVALLINATANHFTAPSFGDDDVFLDADIAILGAQREVYLRYTGQIRAEYHMVPEDLFRAGRTRFLQSATQWPRIFKTDLFEVAYGDQARQNLQWELDVLSGISPS